MVGAIPQRSKSDPISWLVKGLVAPGLYFMGGSLKVGKSWGSRAPCGGRHNCPGICRAIGKHWRRREFCWTQNAATTNGFCLFAWREVTRVTAMTGKARHRMGRHRRHRHLNQGKTNMTYIQQLGERGRKITVCNRCATTGKNGCRRAPLMFPRRFQSSVSGSTSIGG